MSTPCQRRRGTADAIDAGTLVMPALLGKKRLCWQDVTSEVGTMDDDDNDDEVHASAFTVEEAG